MHTRALLSTLSYFNTALPKQVTDPREATKLPDKDVPGKLGKAPPTPRVCDMSELCFKIPAINFIRYLLDVLLLL